MFINKIRGLKLFYLAWQTLIEYTICTRGAVVMWEFKDEIDTVPALGKFVKFSRSEININR